MKEINVDVSDGKGGSEKMTKKIFGKTCFGEYIFYFTQNIEWNERSGLEEPRYVLTCAKSTRKLPCKSGKSKPEALRNAINEFGSTQEIIKLLDQIFKKQ